MTSREIVRNTIRFKETPRLPHDFPKKFGYDSDIATMGMNPSPDGRVPNGPDEWGSVWRNIGSSNVGEVVDYPIKEWSDFDKLSIPDVNALNRFGHLENARQEAGDKYLLAWGMSIYARVHYLRGLENAWADIYENPDELCKLVDVLTDMSVEAIDKFASFGADGYCFCDDWGLQNTLMINPVKWREIWKPRYKRIFDAVHAHGMDAFMHSCGYIVDILDDLIEIGLDVIHMDQQANMGLELLGDRFAGRLTFYSPADIQAVLPTGDIEKIQQYCRDMKKYLYKGGGFIPRWYTDNVGAGHSEEAVRAMCDEFLRQEKPFS